MGSVKRMSLSSSECIGTLLYSRSALSDPIEDRFLRDTLSMIQRDAFLSKFIRPVCVDHPSVKQHLRNNESGLVVTNWPVFVTKFPGEPTRTVPLNRQEDLFQRLRTLFGERPIEPYRPEPEAYRMNKSPQPHRTIPPQGDVLDGIVEGEYEPERPRKSKGKHVKKRPRTEEKGDDAISIGSTGLKFQVVLDSDEHQNSPNQTEVPSVEPVPAPQ